MKRKNLYAIIFLSTLSSIMVLPKENMKKMKKQTAKETFDQAFNKGSRKTSERHIELEKLYKEVNLLLQEIPGSFKALSQFAKQSETLSNASEEAANAVVTQLDGAQKSNVQQLKSVSRHNANKTHNLTKKSKLEIEKVHRTLKDAKKETEQMEKDNRDAFKEAQLSVQIQDSSDLKQADIDRHKEEIKAIEEKKGKLKKTDEVKKADTADKADKADKANKKEERKREKRKKREERKARRATDNSSVSKNRMKNY